MEHSFWHDRWKAGQIGFHEGRVNGLLERHADRLPPPPARIFLPLSGKTADIGWLLSKGYQVRGAELSELAIQQLFGELGVTPEITHEGNLTRYVAESIEILVGDVFLLTADLVGPVDAVYDRAALVALPEYIRRLYTAHVSAMTGNAPQLLITFEYDQSVMPGPPFSVTPDEVSAHYKGGYQITPLETRDVQGGLKGICPATETIWALAR